MNSGEQSSATSKNASKQRLILWATSGGVTLLAFSLLLWSRFIIATNHPRSAYAEPETQQLNDHQQDQQHPQTAAQPKSQQEDQR